MTKMGKNTRINVAIVASHGGKSILVVGLRKIRANLGKIDSLLNVFRVAMLKRATMGNAVLDCKHDRAYSYYDGFYKARFWECPTCLKRLEN